MKVVPGNGHLGAYSIFLFLAALAAHAYFATFNWNSGFMPGHEFRQAQTAIIARYIDEQNNFSPRYETPILGKPWVAGPLEFPLYQWSVVLLAKATGLPLIKAARSVSLSCFYLTLPAIYLLLGQLGLPVRRRLLCLALVLACPVYIFYSRAFLIESMALMFSAWFLLAFVLTLRERRIRWLVLCALSGAAAALVKSTTFFVWLLPAALFGADCLRRDLRSSTRGRSLLTTISWSAAAVIVPFGVVYWWIKSTDAIKATHASAYILTSANISVGNFGISNLRTRFSSETWQVLLERWREAIMSPWIIGVFVVAGIAVSKSERWLILTATGLFLAAQLLFPFAYANQEYYFYACAVFVLCALGLTLHGVLESGLYRWIKIVIVAVPLVILLGNYLRVYRELQSVKSAGGFGLTEALRDCTPKSSVIIVIGDDWSPIIPYYSHHRALMVRSGLERDEAYLERAFHDLADEDVCALVMVRSQRSNKELARRITSRFGLDPETTFSHPVGDVYLSDTYRENALLLINNSGSQYDQVTCQAKPRAPDLGDNRIVGISPGTAAIAFNMVTPAPRSYLFPYGYTKWPYEGADVIRFHPSSDLWVSPPPGATQILWEFGIFPDAYQREGDRTDGVEFIVVGETTGGQRREIFKRLLDPVAVETDRGRQQAMIPYVPVAGETLVFLARPNKSLSFDWAYLRKIEIK